MTIWNNILQGLKTGMYYLRTKPAANAIQFTVDKTKLRNSSLNKSMENGSASPKSPGNVKQEKSEEVDDDLDPVFVCSRDNGENCMACSSWKARSLLKIL